MTRFGVGFDDRARAHREASANPDVVQLGDPRGQRVIEQLGLRGAETVVEPRIGLDHRRGVLGVDSFAF